MVAFDPSTSGNYYCHFGVMVSFASSQVAVRVRIPADAFSLFEKKAGEKHVLCEDMLAALALVKMKNKNFVEKIALERIYRLFELAEKAFAKHPERSRRYVQLAWKISLRNKTRIPSEFKARFCRKCKSYLKKGKNAEVEKKREFLILKCKECSYERKMPLGKGK